MPFGERKLMKSGERFTFANRWNLGSNNLDSDFKDYDEFINSKISLNLKKESHEFGIFYQPHNESGGILFNLFGFK